MADTDTKSTDTKLDPGQELAQEMRRITRAQVSMARPGPTLGDKVRTAVLPAKTLFETDMAPCASGGVPVLAVTGDLNHDACAGLRQSLAALSSACWWVAARTTDVILDMTHCGYMESAALGVIVAHVRAARDADPAATVCLAAPTPFIRRAFEITRMDRLVPVCADVEAAQALIAARRQRGDGDAQ